MARLYDPAEGAILINGQDIKSLRMEDIRRAMAILFQDYTLFPLTVPLRIQRVVPRCADAHTCRLKKILPLGTLLGNMITTR